MACSSIVLKAVIFLFFFSFQKTEDSFRIFDPYEMTRARPKFKWWKDDPKEQSLPLVKDHEHDNIHHSKAVLSEVVRYLSRTIHSFI